MTKTLAWLVRRNPRLPEQTKTTFLRFPVKDVFYKTTIFPKGNADPFFMVGIFSNFSYCGKCNYKSARER